MKAGEIYRHKYAGSLHCEVVRETNRGAEVTVYTNGERPTRAFFDKADMENERGEAGILWVRVKTPEEIATGVREPGADYSSGGKAAPRGYRWVYGELEKIPPKPRAGTKARTGTYDLRTRANLVSS